MKTISFVFLLLPGLTWADAYVCQDKTGRRTTTTAPCPPDSRQINFIPDNTGERRTIDPGSQTREFQRQLNQIRSNQQDLNELQAAQRPPVATQTATFDKRQACETNWKEQEHINSLARQQSSDWLNARKRQLQDERWKLGC